MRLTFPRFLPLTLALGLAFGPALLARAQTAPPSSSEVVFDPSRILSDAEIRRGDAMSLEEIRIFVDAKGGLDDVSDVDPVDGRAKRGAQLVYDAAVRYSINPKYILALLQKESSIVETRVPTQRQKDWAAGYALCDGCRVDSPLARKYQGLARQIDAGAGWMDWYLKNAAELGGFRQAGRPTVINGQEITPANAVTAALYSYTPHFHGNQLLWNIMRRWFGTGADALQFPDGTLVRDPAGGAIALIQGGRFRPVLKPSLLASRFRTANIVDLNTADFEALRRQKAGAPVRFSDYSVVRTEAGDMYLLVGSDKRRIASVAAFAQAGFSPEEVEPVTAADVADYADGTPISGAEEHSLGELIRDPKTGGVWYAESGKKRPLLDRVLLDSNFAGRPIRVGIAAELAALPVGEPVLIADGTLVKSPDERTVYLMSGGRRRPFKSGDDFLGLGFQFSRVFTVSPKLLAKHALGEPIAIPPPEGLFPEPVPLAAQ